MDIGCLPGQIKNKQRMWQINFVLLGIVFFLSMTTFFVGKNEFFVEAEKVFQRKKPIYEEIGWGPLALNEMVSQGPLPFLTKEIIVLGKNDRPGDRGRSFLLGLSSSQEEMTVSEKQPVFLEKKEDGKWHFSLAETDLRISPSLSSDGKVIIHVAALQGVGDFVFKIFDKIGSSIEKTPYVRALENAKFWGHDLLIKNYGGSDYRDLVKKNKVDMGDVVFFLGEEDLLVWKDSRWQIATSPSYVAPMAKVVEQTPASVGIRVWDESGFNTVLVKKFLEKSPKALGSSEELFSSVRVRTPSEITCLMGKRRVVLREGDWWLKMDSNWKKLKTVSDIEDYLDHRLKGELFIFESIVAGNGRVVLKGNCFDVMRTEMQPVTVTASLTKKTKLSPKQKTSPLIAKADESGFKQKTEAPKEFHE